MNKRFIASFTLASFAFISVPVAALPASSQASLTSKGGKVLTKVADGQWGAVSSQALEAGAQVRTGADGTAILRLADNSVVRLAPNSQMTVGESTDSGAVVLLERGRLLGSANAGLRVDTHKTTTVASTGEFVVQTTATGTGLNVLSGNAKLNSKDAEAVGFGIENAEKEIFTADNLNEVQTHGDVLTSEIVEEGEIAAADPTHDVMDDDHSHTQDDENPSKNEDGTDRNASEGEHTGDDNHHHHTGEDGVEFYHTHDSVAAGGGGGNAALITIGAAVIVAGIFVAFAEGDSEKEFPQRPSASNP